MKGLLLAFAHVLAFLCLVGSTVAQDGAGPSVAPVDSRSVVLAVQGLG